MTPLISLLFGAGLWAAFRARQSLIKLLSRRYPTFHNEVSDPSLNGLTTARTFRLQRFIYSLYPEKTGDPELMRLCNFLRIVTPAIALIGLCGLVILTLQAVI